VPAFCTYRVAEASPGDPSRRLLEDSYLDGIVGTLKVPDLYKLRLIPGEFYIDGDAYPISIPKVLS